jgi:hypothetical protein
VKEGRVMTTCKDCSCETSIDPGPDLLKAEWNWIDLVDGDDIANGWRCPVCCAGWKEIVERGGAELH